MPRPASTRRWARLLVLVFTTVSLVVPGTEAEAADQTYLCAGQLAAIDAAIAKAEARNAKVAAHDAAAAAHNAKPNQFILPRQQAAFNAYDAEAQQLRAEAQQLNAELQPLESEFVTAKSRLSACVDSMLTLEDTGAGSPALSRPTPERLKKIEDTAKQVPAGWRPPPPPAPGSNWRVPKGTPVRPLYDELRNKLEFREYVTLRGRPRPASSSRDPAAPASSGRTFGTNAGGLSNAHSDHIIPLAEMIYMRGFLQLTPLNMHQMVTARVNLQWTSPWFNLSKSSRSVAGMSNVDPQWRASQVQLENEVRKQLQDTIDKLLLSQG